MIDPLIGFFFLAWVLRGSIVLYVVVSSHFCVLVSHSGSRSFKLFLFWIMQCLAYRANQTMHPESGGEYVDA